ncbi:acyl-CoA thioesterase [Rhodoferax aquaticus]|uniref:Acyl-CoA thioesterase n=1 Tax=Rhodoferax aquaticus TaxID=2527691 RepID=A0A515EKR2_9BURK|nr:thioesterase family protein [Rhodoferax aquaticus]QDL53248.1 acyl-CoA thioesterase [Rhodoferax aquaticus]
MSTPFTFLTRVRYGECDAQLVVFNARYGDYADLAATEYFRAIFGGIQALLARNLDTQVVHYQIDWTSPARFDDVLGVRVQTERVGTTSFTLNMAFFIAGTQALVATAALTYVLVSTPAFTKTSIPDDLRTALQGGAPDVVMNQSGS